MLAEASQRLYSIHPPKGKIHTEASLTKDHVASIGLFLSKRDNYLIIGNLFISVSTFWFFLNISAKLTVDYVSIVWDKPQALYDYI